MNFRKMVKQTMEDNNLCPICLHTRKVHRFSTDADVPETGLLKNIRTLVTRFLILFFLIRKNLGLLFLFVLLTKLLHICYKYI